MTRTYNQTQYENVDRQRKKAWAMYYNEMGNRADAAVEIINMVGTRENGILPPKENLPSHITTAFYDMATKLNETFTCPICLDLVNKETISITFCGHIYCKECLLEIKAKEEPKCAICRKKL